MISLMIKNIFENSNKIDSVIKHINKTDKRNCLDFLMIGAALYSVTKIVKKHEEKINDLETKLEGIKSIIA